MRQLVPGLLALFLGSTAAMASEWWVIVGYVDHDPSAWDDAVTARANALNAQLAPCGLDAFWDFTAKFDGFATGGRGTVFVVNTPDQLSKSAARTLLARTVPCVPDAYIKQAGYYGE
jgi:hypothetical protein